MSGIRKPQLGDATFDEKLEFVRGTVMMLAEDDKEATTITQTLSVQMSLESKDPEDFEEWCDEYGFSSREIAIEYRRDVMPAYRDYES